MEYKAETIKVPQMAESISEGTLKSWLKQEGETVAADEEVATIETDKVRRETTGCPEFVGSILPVLTGSLLD